MAQILIRERSNGKKYEKQRKEQCDTGIHQIRSADHRSLGGGPTLPTKTSQRRSNLSASAFTHETPDDQTAQHLLTRVMSLQRYPMRIAGGERGAKPGLRFKTPMSEAHPPRVCLGCFPQIQKPVIRIFTVYEHGLNRDRARLMQEQLIRRLGHSFNFSVSWWSLKSFWHPKTPRMAAEAIAQADILLFALLSGGELPQALTQWIEQQLLHKPTHRV